MWVLHFRSGHSFLINWMGLQRADLQKILLDLARPYMKVRLNTKVRDVDPSQPAVILESGEIIKADLVIGADGLNSRLRDIVVGQPDRPTPTGDATYRALIPTGPMMKDPELKQLVDETCMNIWMGPGRHIVGYCIVGHSNFRFKSLSEPLAIM